MLSLWTRAWGVQKACLTALVIVAVPVGAHADSPQERLAVLDSLALEHNQSLQAFDSRAEQAIRQAEFTERRWPQPVVEYMADFSAPWMPHFTVGHTVRLMQTIPRGGARSAEAAPARAQAEVEQTARDVAVLDIFRDLRLHVIEMTRLDARIELLEEEVELLDDAIAVVEEVVPLGRADHSDLLQLELGREAVLDELAQLRSHRREHHAEMAAHIGVSREELHGQHFSSGLLERWLIELPAEEELVEMARQFEPGLAALDAESSVAAARIDAVDQSLRPWPQLMVGYSNRPPMWEMEGPRNQVFQVGFSIELPIFRGQYDIEASQWQAASQAISQQRAQKSEEIRGAVEALVTGWQTDWARLRRHERELVPLAGDLAQRVLIGMELGERSAAEYLLALRQELDLEGRMIELRAALLERLMELQRLTGGQVGADQPWAYPVFEGGQQ